MQQQGLTVPWWQFLVAWHGGGHGYKTVVLLFRPGRLLCCVLHVYHVHIDNLPTLSTKNSSWSCSRAIAVPCRSSSVALASASSSCGIITSRRHGCGVLSTASQSMQNYHQTTACVSSHTCVVSMLRRQAFLPLRDVLATTMCADSCEGNCSGSKPLLLWWWRGS